jgi:hypothetical protein
LLGVLAEKVVLIAIDCRITTDECFESGIVDPLWLELLVDPFVETDRADSDDVTGLRPEGQPAERVDYLLIGGQLTMPRGRDGWDNERLCRRTGSGERK